MGKNEKDKHRHELSLSHRRACAHELQLTDEELGADKSAQPMELAKWVCRECHMYVMSYPPGLSCTEKFPQNIWSPRCP